MINWTKYEGNEFGHWGLAPITIPLTIPEQISTLEEALRVAEKEEKYLACAEILKQINQLKSCIITG